MPTLHPLKTANICHPQMTQDTNEVKVSTPAFSASMDSLLQSLDESCIRSYYQPIVDLRSYEVLGFENLSRGPLGTPYESPLALFAAAEQAGCLLQVERLCRNAGIRRARLTLGQKLFINVSPHILLDPSFRVGETRKVLESAGLTPSQVVFEVTERQAIEDYAQFTRLLCHYREQGYQIAIDDFGAGYSGLLTLIQIKPDFVKIDKQMIDNLDEHPLKRRVVQATCEIASAFSGIVIAEGIETDKELMAAKACGVEVGQGFWFGRPCLAQGAKEDAN
ncbi:EAL domain-containing protein (putative c-di-GMP-specific phosphodiesterase class I) [Alicyclobacillus sacchari]|uniref:EAL domain-containing protein (Putative c-di-GMP-specific phosphodiesterase class I) n=1 Tax=Alicyclobacillus sacchari TaxID=392010 RepID=A0A4R8LX87_9BACL|nr:EAL domain-containing protein [Alicyclobacillus sacchari]TDY51427.1 EAL domain-containing protein (putative c-di-GMP-specific phosphodiesterase class I) [Alicyclobacillus sacchari]GMA56771.1 hypothetical protein GCM10025858_12740 [Alicyclobacillus sacchari]